MSLTAEREDEAGAESPDRAVSHPKSTRTIEPPKGGEFIDLSELWRFRELLFFLIWRDVKVRYKQTVMGAAWAVLQPAMMMAVFTLFFQRMAGISTGDTPYPLFVYAGLLPWTFFSTALAGAGQSVVNSERLITKVYFPRAAVPLATVGAALVDFLFAFGLLLVLMAYYGFPPGPNVLLFLPLMFVVVMAAAGMGTLLAALNIAYRDFRYVVPFLVQVWMFATPSIYMDIYANKPPGGGRMSMTGLLLSANPMTPLIAALRSSLLGGPIDWPRVAVATALVAFVALCGGFYFRRIERQFSDII